MCVAGYAAEEFLASFSGKLGTCDKNKGIAPTLCFPFDYEPRIWESVRERCWPLSVRNRLNIFMHLNKRHRAKGEGLNQVVISRIIGTRQRFWFEGKSWQDMQKINL